MSVSCGVKRDGSTVTEFLSEWKGQLDNFNTVADKFRDSVIKKFGKSLLGLQRLQKVLDNPKQLQSLTGVSSIDFSVKDLLPNVNNHALDPNFKKWGLTSQSDELTLFSGNLELLRNIKKRFFKDAYKACVVNTDAGVKNPLVTSDEILQINISELKENLVKRLIIKLEDPELNKFLVGYQVFDPKIGADGSLYSDIMSKASALLTDKSLKSLNPYDSADSRTVEMLYLVLALNNFDYFLDQAMDGILTKSKANESGDLNRTEYLLADSAENEQQDLQGISDEEYSNATHFATPSAVKIINSISKVVYNLNSDERLIIPEDSSTLHITHALQLSHWIQLNLPKFKELFDNDQLNFRLRPEYTIRTVLKGIHDAVVNYDVNTTDEHTKAVQEFILGNNGKQEIQVALSLYEYLFNEDDRIDPGTISISSINKQLPFHGTPKFNIINEILLQMTLSVAPTYIEYNLNGTIWDLESDDNPLQKNLIQRFENNSTKFIFLNPIKQCVQREGLAEESTVAKAILNDKQYTTLEEEFADSSTGYLEAVKELLSISDKNDDQIKGILLEADKQLGNNSLHRVFKGLANLINNIQPDPDIRKYWEEVDKGVKNAANVDYDQLGMLLSGLMDSTPASVFTTITGNQIGIYRLNNMSFMFDHAIDRYKKPDSAEQLLIDSDSTYIPKRKRCNFIVDNSGILQRGDNDAYLSSIGIPLTMGDAYNAKEAARLPDFVQDTHAFVGGFMSLMMGLKNKKSTPMMAIQLGAYSDKSTLIQLMLNGRVQLKGNVTIGELMSDPYKLTRYTLVYQAINSLDYVNHIVEDWLRLFKGVLNKEFEYDFKGKHKVFMDALSKDKSLLKINTITDKLISKQQSDLFADFLSDLDDEAKFDALMSGDEEYSIDAMYKQTMENVKILENIFEKLSLSTSFVKDILPQVAQKLKIKLVDLQHADLYDGIYKFNKVMLQDLEKNCTKQYVPIDFDRELALGDLAKDPNRNPLATYNLEMFRRGMTKTFMINGKETSFLEHLQHWFEANQKVVQNMIGRQSQSSKERIALFDNLYNGNEVNLEALETLYFNYLTFTNFVRHQALDLTVKEAYADKGANNDVRKERSKRLLTTNKRNNAFTASVTPFMMDLAEGVRQKIKICVIDDIKGGVFNTIGSDEKVTEYDGLGFVSSILARMESKSLGDSHTVSTKKTFIVPISDYNAEELKWASNEITNKKIRESQGCLRPLLSIFRRMHSIDFPINTDLTKLWKYGTQGLLFFSNLLGKNLYAREGNKYYRYSDLTKIEGQENSYELTKVEVDPITGEDKVEFNEEGNNIFELTYAVKLNNLYDVYTALNGINCVEFTKNGMEYSEDIMDLLYQLTVNVGEKTGPGVTQGDLYQPIAECFIGILATKSSNKRGASNIVTGEAWTNDDIPLSYSEIEIAAGGKQLDAEHHSDGSTITKGTQMIQTMALNGYNALVVEDMYKSIALVMNHSSEDFDKLVSLLSDENADNKIKAELSKKILKDIEITGNTVKFQNLISLFEKEAQRNGQDMILPLSMIVKDVIKTYAPELNKNIIKQKDAGLMGTLTGSSGFIQVYDFDGMFYTAGDFLDLKTIQAYDEKFGEGIRKYLDTSPVRSNGKKITYDDCILTIALLDKSGSLESALNTETNIGTIPVGIDLILSQSVDDTARLNYALNKLANKESGSSYGYQKIKVSEVRPGDTVVDPLTKERVLIDSAESILNLKNFTRYVLLDTFAPADLRPSVSTITYADGTTENEYTSRETMLFAILNRIKKNKATEKDLAFNSHMLKFFGIQGNTFSAEQLELIQEFASNLKGLGYALDYNNLNLLTDTGLLRLTGNKLHFPSAMKTVIAQDWINQLLAKEKNGEYGALDYALKERIRFWEHTNKDEKQKPVIQALLDGSENRIEFFKDRQEVLFDILQLDDETEFKNYLSRHGFKKIISYSHAPALIIMPNIYKTVQGIGNTNIKDVTPESFKVKSRYKIHLDFIDENGNVTVDFVVRDFNRAYNIVVASKLSDESLDRFGDTISQTDLYFEDGYRIDNHSKAKLYKLPEHGKYIIKRKNGVETIILKQSPSIYNDILTIVHSDERLVTVQPFLYNLANKRDRDGLNTLLDNVKIANTFSIFEDNYDLVKQLDKKEIIPFLNKEYQRKELNYTTMYKNLMYQSFQRSLDVIATRIPTQNMSSVMPMKVASFTGSKLNEVFVTKWQNWIQGSDFDIDKAFILGYNFDKNGVFVKWSRLQQLHSQEVFEASLGLPIPSQKSLNEYEVKTDGSYIDNLMDSYIEQYQEMDSTYPIMTDRKKYIQLGILSKILKRLEQVGGIYISYGNKDIFENLIRPLINFHNLSPINESGIKNFTTYLMHKVMNSPSNATSVYKSIDVATEAFTDPIDNLPSGELSNLDDGHSTASSTAAGATGKQDVGIAANGTKDLFTLVNYFTLKFTYNCPLTLNELLSSHAYNLSTITLHYVDKNGKLQVWSRAVGPVSDTKMYSHVYKMFSDLALQDFNRGFHLYEKDASLGVGALLSLAADNAKTLALDKIHAETDYFAMHIFLALMGVPSDIIVAYFTSPDFKRVIESVLNDFTQGNSPEINVKTFTRLGLDDMAHIFKCGQEITSLAQLLSINQGVKVELKDMIGQSLKLKSIYDSALSLNFKNLKNSFSEMRGDVNMIAQRNGTVTYDRADRADALMKKLGITLKTPFDINRFFTDAEYAECIKTIYDVVKLNFNVFDVIDSVPHFREMFTKYKDLLSINSKGSHTLHTLIENTNDYYHSEIIKVPSIPVKNGEEIEAFKVPKSITSKQVNKLKNHIDNLVFAKFLKDEASKSRFEYKYNLKNISVNFNCDFLTDQSLHRFLDFMYFAVFPELQRRFRNNSFLNNISTHTAEAKDSDILIYRSDLDLAKLQSQDIGGNSITFNQIKEDFNAIKDIPISSLVTNASVFKIANLDTTVGDFLFIYDKIAKTASPRGRGFDILFDDFDNTMAGKFARFLKAVDMDYSLIDINPTLFTASVVKDLVPEIKKVKSIEIKGQDPILLQNKVKGQEYTRFMIEMPLEEQIHPLYEYSELLMNALLDERLKITKLDLNC